MAASGIVEKAGHLVSTTPDYFEAIYAEAGFDRSRVPWEDGHPSPALINWMNAVAPSLIRCGARVAVVGCGYGDDAIEIANRGYEVTAFDCSATAIHAAIESYPAQADSFHVADLFNLPSRWRHRFDLVVEINTLQALTPDVRDEAMQSIADLVSPRGYLLVICRGSGGPVKLDDGPPWPLSQAELERIAAGAKLHIEGGISTFLDNESPPVKRMRAVFRHADA